MKAVVQRVAAARVEVEGRIVGQIERGLLVYLGCGAEDTTQVAERLLSKILGLRIFENAAGKLDFSVQDTAGQLLVVSQFTLYANTSSGRRPSFEAAMPPAQAEVLYQHFIELAATQIPTASGIFRATMAVHAVVDGPFTLTLELHA